MDSIPESTLNRELDRWAAMGIIAGYRRLYDGGSLVRRWEVTFTDGYRRLWTAGMVEAFNLGVSAVLANADEMVEAP